MHLTLTSKFYSDFTCKILSWNDFMSLCLICIIFLKPFHHFLEMSSDYNKRTGIWHEIRLAVDIPVSGTKCGWLLLLLSHRAVLPLPLYIL